MEFDRVAISSERNCVNFGIFGENEEEEEQEQKLVNFCFN